MTDTVDNTITSPPLKRRKLSGTMSSPTPSLKPSALDRTQSLRKPMSTAGLMKDTTITAAVVSNNKLAETNNAETGIKKHSSIRNFCHRVLKNCPRDSNDRRDAQSSDWNRTKVITSAQTAKLSIFSFYYQYRDHHRNNGKDSATTTTAVTKSPPLRQPITAPSAAATRNVVKLKPKPHIPEPLASSTSSLAAPQQQQQPRHNFDTYQQHYTPAQIPLLPKPLTSSFLAPPTPSKQPANVALSAEISRLQTELLQSHLLHQEAKRVKEEWEEDARGKLQEMWERVRAEERTVGEMEGKEGEEGVVEGLLAMAGFGGTLDQTKLQALDEVISGVWAMSDLSSPSSSSGVTIGKYTRVVRAFEVWAGRAGRILEERRRSAADNEDGRDGALMLDANGEVEMIGGMDLEWKNECVALGRRLEKWRRMLGELGGVSSKANYGSSFRSSRPIKGVEAIEREADKGEEGEDDESPLVRTLSRFGSLVDNMLAELQIMAQIEREAVAEEIEWVRRLNRVDDEKEGEEIMGKRATAIWRVI
ncbi:hypothetical protein NCU00084 [Neurospora crassa OR74A]|uniref:Uncharacterized protein n=1 Tax=Neurospora crassa (strain ATCC 24698 / 74-OR23-1A / CBS 708.71 / DSM 1257 / FGSC 987) TaxID=367110 RepID=Q7RYP3_NEUCR|nr:hypothetical protein NCU00084 [Neurospora crassa OR74A]EAA27972.2 hypothetical protein NCU00084 [Neurospora crassa OR74A]|eukprot:XP_957208.2 hypothetical protein NCU00084 [Neurospora crassa OR74A]